MRLEEAKRDHYRKLAKWEGFRSRAAFKLTQINEKYQLFGAESCVIDVGCAPGGWLEVASKTVGQRGLVVGVDFVDVRPLGEKNVVILKEDITSASFLGRLKETIGKTKADSVLADLSPKLSGIWDMDHFRQIELCHKVLDVLPEILTEGGSSVMKAFHGAELEGLVQRLRGSFERVDVSKPDASRKESSEVYLVSQHFRGQVPSRPDEPPRVTQKSEWPDDSIDSGLQDDRLPES
jgi:23S rRNA (uridine2552-2'-O)-methyltransferase